MNPNEPSAWQSLLAGDGLGGWESGGPKTFSRLGDTVTGADGGYGDRLMTGRDEWTDYEFAAHIAIAEGALAQLHVRISPAHGHRGWYALDLLPKDGKVRLGWADNRPGGPGLVAVATASRRIELLVEHDVRVVVRGATLTAFVDGDEVVAMTDARYASGRVGLGLYDVRATFRDPRIRLLA